MMACCIIAAMILAQITATVRRWGIFWGVVRPVGNEELYDTALRRMAGWLRRPGVRKAVFTAAALEFAALSGWVYVAHGDHVYQFADQFAGAMRGQQIVYAGKCGKDDPGFVLRIAVDRPRLVALRALMSEVT